VRIVPVADELRRRTSFKSLRQAWPEFLLHDPNSNRYWSRLYDDYPDFQFAAVDGNEVLAEGNALPMKDLPDGWRDAFRCRFERDEPSNVLCALAVLVGREHQGQGLSRAMLEHMRALAADRGWDLVAPVRPTLKATYPLVPIEHYADWRRSDGLLFDPWLRTHERLGARVEGIAAEAMRVPGTVSEWEAWAGMAFPESGSYVVPGALTLVEIDREDDAGLYVEPNVWMRHRR
jgi:GNAT superfamily N-acetyltransferase